MADKKVAAERFVQLKAKVKAEMLRRNQSGSVASYGGAAYDYSVVPASGKIIKEEHRNKNIIPMNAVNSDKVPLQTGKNTVIDSQIQNMETLITAWSARSMTDRSASDCKSGCTGTCYSGCATSCYTGCSGSCKGTCTGGCTGGCSNCGGCDDDCWSCGGCDDGCYRTCESGCSGSCGDCRGCGTCSGCGQCCAANCSGCGASCSANCAVGSHDWQ